MPRRIRQRSALRAAANFSLLAVVGSLLFGPPATADASAISLSPSSQTVVIGQQLTDITPTVTGTTVNRLANLLNVRTIAGPSGAGVSPATVTTNELVGIQAVVQVANGDFYTLQRSMNYIAPTQPDTIAHISRATGATTVLTASTPLSGSISVQNIQADGSGNIYVAIGNDVVQLAITGTSYAETGRKVSFTNLVNFQVTDAGRVYGIGASGTANEYNVFTAEIPGAVSTVTATQYPSNGPVVFSSFDGVTGVYVDENVSGNSSNSRVFATTKFMAQVLMADVVNNVSSTSYGLSNNAGISNYQYSSQMVMDDADNLYFLTQNNVRKINTAGFTSASPLRVSEFQIGPEIVFDQVLSTLYRNTAATAGYIDGPFGVSRIYTGGPIVTGSAPPSIDGSLYRTGGGLALDLKGSNPTGELIIADTGNAALRAMNRVGWSVSPELHAGLSLSASGEITGTPTGVVGLTPANNTKTYTVSYHNTNGTIVSGTTNVTFEIAPTNFIYRHGASVGANLIWAYVGLGFGYTWGTSGQGVFALNATIPPACPATNLDTSGNSNPSRTLNSSCGSAELVSNANLGLPAATTFSISPALPTGVVFDTTTGAIYGTPTAYSDVQNYTITATNAHGSATYTMPFGVPAPKTITFDPNGGTGTMADQQSTSSTQISSNQFTPPTGKVFSGWNTVADGSGFAYGPFDNYAFTSDVTLYAQWRNQLTLNKFANGGVATQASVTNGAMQNIGDVPTFPALQVPGGVVLGYQDTFLDDLNEPWWWALEKPGFPLFAGWSTTQNGVGGDIFFPAEDMILNADTDLYALWVAAGSTFTLTYDLQGGVNSGAVLSPITGNASGATMTVDAGTNLSKTGYVFGGWNSKADGTGASRNSGFKIFNDTTAYAIWLPAPTITSSAPATIPLAGGQISLVGSGLNSGTITSITIGGQSVSSWLVNAPGTQIALTAPALTAGTHQVVVTIGGNQVTFNLTYGASSTPVTPSTPGSSPGSQVPGSFSGPVVAPAPTPVPAGAPVTLNGSGLGGVNQVTVSGQNASITATTPSSVQFVVPTSVPTGTHSVVLSGTFGSVTLQNAITVISAQPEGAEPLTSRGYWTQLQSDGTVKMYAKDVILVGKVQFFLDAKEVAWVRAVDATDPKLSSAKGFSYLVRSFSLRPGKNRFEIKLNGDRVWRATYVPKG